MGSTGSMKSQSPAPRAWLRLARVQCDPTKWNRKSSVWRARRCKRLPAATQLKMPPLFAPFLAGRSRRGATWCCSTQPPRSWLREERIELRMQSRSPLSRSILALLRGSWTRSHASHQPRDDFKTPHHPRQSPVILSEAKDLCSSSPPILFCLLHDLEVVIRCVALRHAAIVDYDFLRSRGNFHANHGFILGANFEPAHDLAAGKFDYDRDLGSGRS